MRRFMMTLAALAAFGAMVVTAQAENRIPNPPTVSRPVTIYARVNGYVPKLIAHIGDRVKKDQLLATIDTPVLDAQLEAAQAQLNASEAEVKVKEAVVDFAKTTNDRWWGPPGASFRTRSARTKLGLGANVTSIDISEPQIEARSRAAGLGLQVDFARADVVDLSGLADATFDVIYAAAS